MLRALGPSLGVYWMQTKMKDHGPKSGGVDFLIGTQKKKTV